MNIPDHRKAIDKFDTQIVKLLNERTKHVLAIGEMKRKAGEEIYAPHRERAVLQRLCRKNEGPLTNESLRAIYREVMSSALSLEKSLTVAYLGPEATFTHQAAIQRFGSSLRYTPQKTITDVFTEVSKNRADYGVVPVENTTEGAVTHTLDMFVDSDLKIVAQLVLPVQHCLLANCPRSKIKKLYAHPQALGQCRAWVQAHLPRVEIVESSSNARSAELAAKEKGAAAIAGLLAAERYDVPVLDHASLMFSVVDRVGALYHSLVAFRRYRVNMTKIESRPSKRKAWDYIFFVDCEGHVEDRRLSKAISNLGEHCSYVKVLGSYPDSD
jgi:chorismate mutase/prephenate dehydratase